MTPIRLTEDSFWKNIPECGDVYFIYSYNNKSPVKINRVLGVDKEGVLYIGKSENLRERLRMLWRVLNPNLKATAHTFGTKYNNKKNEGSIPFEIIVCFI